jgi:zinc protease
MIRKLICLAVLVLLMACSQGSDDARGKGDSGDIRFVGIPSQTTPVVYFYVAVEFGSTSDPAGKEGLVWFTANLMRRGTESFSRDEIDSKLEEIGGKLDIRVDRKVIVISGQTLLENLDQYYEIFADILLHPAFPEDEVENLRMDQEQALNEIIRDDSRLSKEVLISSLYGENPLAHPVPGYFSTIPNLTVEKAREFYDYHFLPAHMIFGLAGNYSEEFAQKFQDDMAELPGGALREEYRGIIPANSRRVVIVQKEGRDQAQLRMGKVVEYTRFDEVWFPLLVANTYLGQHRESFGRLFQTIRAERGMSYGAYSYHEHFQPGGSKNSLPLIPFKPQYFSVWTYPKKNNVEFAIKMALFELQDLIANGMTVDRLEKVKDFQINHFPFLVETTAQRLAMSIEEIYYGQPNFVENFETNIANVSRSDLIAALSRYWSSDDLTIVVVTDDAEELKAELLTAETALELPRGATGEGLEAMNERVKNLDLKLKPEDIIIVNAEELFR